jgi:hypothetical protein
METEMNQAVFMTTRMMIMNEEEEEEILSLKATMTVT